MKFLQTYFGNGSWRRLLILLPLYVALLSASLFFAFAIRYYALDDWEIWSARFLLTSVWLVPLQIILLASRRHFSGILGYFRLPELYRVIQALALAALLAAIASYLTGEIRLMERSKMTNSILPFLDAVTAILDNQPKADALTSPLAAQAARNAGRLIPYLVILANFFFTLLSICALRVSFRIAHDYQNSRNDAALPGPERPRRMAVLGAGDVGAALVADWLARPGLRRQPVVFLDDNPAKHGLRIHNIPVAGDIAQLAAAHRKYRLDEVVVAIGRVPPQRFREIIALARALNLRAEVVPSLAEMASGRARVSRIRPVEVQDLLGRNQVTLDADAIGSLLRGKTVLVTGAGGSIGSELCRQIASRAPGRILLVERCEAQLFIIEQNLLELGLGTTVQPLLGDITDETRMRHILALHKPDIIFHAAAHKHVFLVERQPWEAIRNNTLGTRLLASLAVEYGVPRFVLISTDKAINPTSVMGATKRMAEIYLQALQAARCPEKVLCAPFTVLPQPTTTASSELPPTAASSSEKVLCAPFTVPPQPTTTASSELPPTAARSSTPPTTRLMAVRFGNVLGSSGSVVPIFTKQIAEGGPVKVTHPEVTRYFMTIPEAVGLVLQCAVLGQGGEIFVLNMGKPVKIADLARQMIELSGLRPDVDIPIEYIGLRPGEKLYEELRYDDETHAPTSHPDIMRLVTPPDALDTVNAAFSVFGTDIYRQTANDLKRSIQKIVPEYRPHLSE